MDYGDLLEERPENPLITQAIEACPWQNTDHLGDRRYNYCTWCDGFVTAALFLKEKMGG